MGLYDGFEVKKSYEPTPTNDSGGSSSYTSNSNNFNSGGNGSSQNSSWGGKKQWNNKKDEDIDPSKVFVYRPYIITGDRNTPPEVADRMIVAMKQLEEKHFTTRTTGLDGPDNAVEAQATNLELFLPWKGFNNKVSKNYYNTKECLIIAKQFHPAFDGLKPAIHAFLGCNVRLVLGNNLKSAARFMICYTEDGAENEKSRTSKTGNLGLPISIATTMRIPVFNFRHTDAEERLYTFLS